jgi:hypothetical protein
MSDSSIDTSHHTAKIDAVREYCVNEHKKILQELIAYYQVAFHKEEPFKHGQVAWQGTYVAALLSLAAMLASDTDMPIGRFIAIAHESFENADKSAPRFG